MIRDDKPKSAADRNDALSRRGFVSGAMGVAAAIAAAGFGGWSGLSEDAHAAEKLETEQDEEVIASTCRNCYGKCPLYGHVRNGRLVKITPKKDTYAEGTLCSKAYAIPSLMYSPKRMIYPMQQVGERGKGNWKRISWDEAWDIIIREMKDAHDNYGGNSIMFNNGTARDQVQIVTMAKVFQNLGSVGGFGVGSVCREGSEAVENRVLGSSTLWAGWDGDNTELLLIWGRGIFAQGAYIASRVQKVKDRGGKVVVIDPRYTCGARMADLWLPVRPGSDLALALCMIREIIERDAIDKEYVARWTNACFLVNPETSYLMRESDIKENGSNEKFLVWDEATNSAVTWDSVSVSYDSEVSSPALFGEYDVAGMKCKTSLQLLKECVADWTVEKAAEITWLNPADVQTLVDLYVSHPGKTSFTRAQKLDMCDNASSMSHAITIFMMLGGNLESDGGNILKPPDYQVPGAGLIFGGAPMTDEFFQTQANLDTLAFGGATCKIYGQDVGYPAATVRTLKTFEPFEPRFLWVSFSNPVMMNPGSSTVAEAINRIHFHVGCDYLLTSCNEMADIFLPAAHHHEVDRLERYVYSNSNPADIAAVLYARQSFGTPPGECRDELDIMWELGTRMGLDMGWKDKYGFFDFQLTSMGMTYDEFRKNVELVTFPAVSNKHATGMLRTDGKPGFATDTGKMNMYSEDLLKFGYGPLPEYREQVFSPISEADMYGNGEGEYPLILLSGGRSHQYFHTDYRDSCLLRSIHPSPIVEIHPDEARKHGIEEGDWAWIESPFGRITQRVHITSGINPHVIHCEHGWWFPEMNRDDGMHGSFICNPNELYPSPDELPFDPTCGTIPMHMLVKISKADGAPEGMIATAKDAVRLMPTFDSNNRAIYSDCNELVNASSM